MKRIAGRLPGGMTIDNMVGVLEVLEKGKRRNRDPVPTARAEGDRFPSKT